MKKAELEALVEEQAAQIKALERKLQSAQWDIEHEKEQWTRVAGEHNKILDMLSEVFDFHVYGEPTENKELLWHVADKESKQVLGKSLDLAEAYSEALMTRLTGVPVVD